MSAEIFLTTDNKAVIGAIAIASFAIFAASLSEGQCLLVWTLISVSGVYYAATRRLGEGMSLIGIVSTMPVTFLSAIASVTGAYALGNLIGHPIQGDPIVMVKGVVGLCLVGNFGVVARLILGAIVTDYLASSGDRRTGRWIFSRKQAFLVGDWLLILFAAFMYWYLNQQ